MEVSIREGSIHNKRGVSIIKEAHRQRASDKKQFKYVPKDCVETYAVFLLYSKLPETAVKTASLRIFISTI